MVDSIRTIKEKVVRIHKKADDLRLLIPFVISLLILVAILLKNSIPVILIFAYVALFNKKYTLAVLITIPIYESYIGGGWLSANKIGIIIIMAVFLIYICYRKIKLGFNEIIFLCLTAVVAFSYVIALTSPLFEFMRDGVMKEFLLGNLPKLAFVMSFLLAVRTSWQFNLREMVDAATIFAPVMLIAVTVPAVLSQQAINNIESRYVILGAEPNYFALFISSVIPFSIRLLLKKKSLVNIILGLLSTGCCMYLLALTASRTGFVIMIVAIAVSILLFTEKKKRLLIAVPAILALTALITVLVEPARNLLMRFLGREMLSSIHKFLSGRWHLFVTAFGHYFERPLIGYGGSVEATAILIFKSTDMAKVVHNDYLGVAIQYGLPGILVFMVMYLKLIGDFI
ncbi:MAG: O-antigen ligase family protein, partial [Clostridia bacterium]|nr:O-antigen ligase family protein [Clostridia bacterium]